MKQLFRLAILSTLMLISAAGYGQGYKFKAAVNGIKVTANNGWVSYINGPVTIREDGRRVYINTGATDRFILRPSEIDSIGTHAAGSNTTTVVAQLDSIFSLTIPDQFNPIAGSGVSFTGSYPNITINASGASKYVPLIIFNGESNSGGDGVNSELTTAQRSPRPALQILNNNTRLFESLDIGANNWLGHCGPYGCFDSNSHGWENGLAKTFEAGQWYSNTGYLIKTGQGGCTIAQLDSFKYVDSFIVRYTAAKSLLKQAGKIPYPVIFYTQGINDKLAGTNLNTWKNATITHLLRLRSYAGYAPIIVPRFMSGYSDYDSVFNLIADSIHFMYFVPSTSLPLVNSLHWGTAGLDSLGQRMARVFIDSVGQEDAYAMSQAAALSTKRIPAAAGLGGGLTTIRDDVFTSSISPYTAITVGSGTVTVANDGGTNKMRLFSSGGGSDIAVANGHNLYTVGDVLYITLYNVTITTGTPKLTVGTGAEYITNILAGTNTYGPINTAGSAGSDIYIQSLAGAAIDTYIGEAKLEK